MLNLTLIVTIIIFAVASMAACLIFCNHQIKTVRSVYRSELQQQIVLMNAVSNQIREPLNKMLPQLQILQRRLKLEGRQQETSFKIKRSSKELQSSLSMFSKIVETLEGRLPFSIEIFDVKEVVEEIAAEFRNNGDELKTQFDTRAGPWVSANKNEIKNCIHSLLDTCILVANGGPVQLRYRIVRTKAGGYFKARFHLPKVQVNHLIRKIFFDFSKVTSNPLLRGRPDAIIAMYITRETAKLLGGSLSVYECSEKGLTLEFKVKVKPEDARNIEKKPKSAADDGQMEQPSFKIFTNSMAGVLNNKAVLIVDDIENNRFALEEMLKSFGLRKVTHAGGGRQAIHACKNLRFDYIFMDIQMPEVNGLKASEEIRRLSNMSSKACIIAVTAKSRIVNESMCRDSGMNGLMEKPVQKTELKNFLK